MRMVSSRDSFWLMMLDTCSGDVVDDGKWTLNARLWYLNNGGIWEVQKATATGVVIASSCFTMKSSSRLF